MVVRTLMEDSLKHRRCQNNIRFVVSNVVCWLSVVGLTINPSDYRCSGHETMLMVAKVKYREFGKGSILEHTSPTAENKETFRKYGSSKL